MICSLVSDGWWMTGHTILVNGGCTANSGTSEPASAGRKAEAGKVARCPGGRAGRDAGKYRMASKTGRIAHNDHIGASCPPKFPVRVRVFPLLPRSIALSLFCLLVCLQTGAPARAAEWQYRVRPGDTLWDLAARHMKHAVDWRRLQTHNRIADPYRIPPGTRLRFPVEWLRIQPQAAVVVALHGDVRVRTKAGAPPVPAAQGMRLRIGAALETGDDASATIRFADGSRTLVMSGSRIEFDQLSAYGATGMVDTRMRLQRGRASNQVTPARGPASRFIVETPSATTSVRGTRFRVAAGTGEASSITEVLEGLVSVSTKGKRIELSRGYGASAGAGAADAPQPQALLPAPRFASPPAEAHGAPEIAWAPLAGAERYRVMVSEAGQSDALLFERVVSGDRARLPALAPGEYMVALRGIAASGFEGIDAGHRIRILPGPPAPLALRVADVDGRVAVPRPRFGWAEVEDAVGYHVQIARDAEFGDVIEDVRQLRKIRFRSPRDLPPGVYHWRVAARDAEGNTGPYDAAERFVVLPAPPRELHMRNDERILRWEDAGAGSRYRVQMARRADFARPAVDRVVDAPQLDLRELGGGRWHVRVQVVHDDGYAEPFDAPQTIRLACSWCKIGAAAAGLLLLTL